MSFTLRFTLNVSDLLYFLLSDRSLQDSSLHTFCNQLPAHCYWKGNIPASKLALILQHASCRIALTEVTLFD